MYVIEYSEGAVDDLKGMRAYDRTRVLDRIEGEPTGSPTEATRNKKPLPRLVPPWEYLPPVWQLRVGDHRAFYDVDDVAQLVTVRAVRCKPPHATTEDIL
jgi:mRNA-degrading endonuclease RelE of RelBE toxin-antitoxin system